MPSTPSAAPTSARPARLMRFLALAIILVAGLSGGLIGFAFIDLQCTGDCGLYTGIGALVGAVGAAGGVAVVAVLALRATDEWRSALLEEPAEQAEGTAISEASAGDQSG